MTTLLAHATGLEAMSTVAIFVLGWILGGVSALQYFRRKSRS